ncbi:hypothetical protein SASPL_100051 [Salvia splendens]|uniref:Uncharacterized protein n=1 Tax=Salvia splendens TaxID=180675 RepID=A0A8X8YS13_SALSN|nr:hypothetical protein SASPL_100051 [Salvia splendens]
MERSPQPSGICQRLFRLVFGALRRPPALPAPPSSRPVYVEGSEIGVEFNHDLRARDGLIVSGEESKHAQDGAGKRERDKEHKSVSFKGSEGKEEGSGSDDEDATIAMDEAKTRRHWPLLNVASNINEKSEAFIERKKKAMGRNYSLN